METQKIQKSQSNSVKEDIKLYHTVIVIQTVGHWDKNRHATQMEEN